MSFSDRLKLERKRLKITQKQLAAKLEVTEQAQVAYEKGRVPNFVNYLEGLSSLGFDTTFLLTGQHAGVVLSEEEQEIFSLLRTATPAVRQTVLTVLKTGIVITKQVNVGRDLTVQGDMNL